MDIWPGKAAPLGATFDGAGTNFALYSSIATAVELCLIEGASETRIPLTEVDGGIWHCYIPGVRSGTRYGYRVHGPWDPAKGLRCDPSKLLLDPYAKAIDGTLTPHQALFSYDFNDPSAFHQEDSRPYTMLGVVINPFFDWGYDRPPEHDYSNSIIYEAHIRGMTMLHPEIPQHLRGTYLGMCHPVIIEYLKNLGITAVELMPCHQFVNDPYLREKGLSNYWGYNTIGFFAPHNGYLSSTDDDYGRIHEFKQMVKSFHEADIEVIMDVVYNHTAEGNHLGPTISLRGIDNPSYYRLVEGDEAHYFDTTGTGNSLNMRSPHTLQLIMDSLRYWITDMHVDGFRFDLASTLARELHSVDRLSSFFDIIQQDPIISRVKLIAEPWDVGEGGYNVGEFPPLWSEWNGKYRDTVRDFWRGEPAMVSELAYRLAGSSDLYESSGRRPMASINFVTAHDGFTLRDLVSYNEKHNEANGEGGRDGESNNRSWNCGTEGETTDFGILCLRRRQVRNFLATLLISQGVPMIAHGDEIGRTQGGNNNVYCQDNETSWVHWDAIDPQLFEFTSALVKVRKQHPILRRRRFLSGESTRGGRPDIGEIEWLRPDGSQMQDDDWHAGFARALMVFLNGHAINEVDMRGEEIVDDDFLITFNASGEPVTFTTPESDYAPAWVDLFDTGAANPISALAAQRTAAHGHLSPSTQESSHQPIYYPGDSFRLEPHSMRVMLCKREDSTARHSLADPTYH